MFTGQNIQLQHELWRRLHKRLEQPQQGGVGVLVDHVDVVLDVAGPVAVPLRSHTPQTVHHRLDVPGVAGRSGQVRSGQARSGYRSGAGQAI